MDVFSSADLRRIARNTNKNFHVENDIFIAKKINSPLLKELQGILNTINRVGYMDSELNEKAYGLHQSLMSELEDKHPDEYTKVHSRL